MLIDLPLTKNKVLRIHVQLDDFWAWPPEAELWLKPLGGEDHAGVGFDFFFGYLGFVAETYDRRHWNHIDDQWRPYPPCQDKGCMG